MKYKLAIFDLDGTILDTLEDLTDSTNHILSSNGYPIHSIDEVRSYVGNGIYMLIKRAAPNDTEEKEIQRLFEQFVSYYKDHCAIKTKAYEGIKELLVALKEKGIKRAVVSNKGDFAVRILIDDYFASLFEISVGEKQGVRKKPYPDSVNEVLRELSVTKEEAVYIGDSEVDIQTAKNAGLACISVSYGFRSKEFLKENGASLIVEDVKGLYKELLGDE